MTHYIGKLRFDSHELSARQFFKNMYDVVGQRGAVRLDLALATLVYFRRRALSYGDLRHSISAPFYAVALSWWKCMAHYDSSPTSSPSVNRNLLRNVFHLRDRLIRNGTKHVAPPYISLMFHSPLRVNEARYIISFLLLYYNKIISSTHNWKVWKFK